ncbi:MAG: prephenate dehydratase [Verrucomicrobia bacterium]|nr:prephenate dehydratase [Verrucomicrobiota bacterium]
MDHPRDHPGRSRRFRSRPAAGRPVLRRDRDGDPARRREARRMSLEEHRREVDRIDREILKLLGERLQVARAIGEAKLKSGAPVYAPQREEQLLRSITEAAPSIPASGLRAVYREIISLSIGAQMAKPVAYLGPEGSFTQQAQIRAFGTSVPSLPLRAIGDIFAAVESGEASYGVVPVENSTEGVVSHSLDLLAESELKVVAQVTLSVEQCLVGQGPLDQVKKVLSKDIALAQCRGWLSRHVPSAVLVETDSTAAAVELVSRDPQGQAAVASATAAESRGVPILARGIQDRRHNATRFFVIAKAANAVGAKDEVTSVVLTLKHEPVDFPGHWDTAAVQAAVTELKGRCEVVKWLGSYPQSAG